MLNYGSRGEGLLQQPAHASALLDWTVGVSRLGRVLAKVLGPCQEVSDTLDGQAGLLDRALHVSPRLDDLWRERAALHLARDGPEGVHESARCLETAVDLLRAEVAVLTDPQVRAGWLAGLTGLLETLAATAAAAAARSAPGPAAEVPARMVSLAQFLRARGRRDLVRNLRGLQEQTAEEQAEAEELLARVQALQRWLARLDALDRRRAESPSRDVVIIEVVKSRKEHWPPDPLEEVAAEVVHAYPAYAGLTTRGRIHEELVRCKDLFARRVGASAFLRARLVQAESEAPMETAALQAGLAEDELVLDYYLGPSALHVGVIGRTCLQVLSLPTGGLRDLGMLACRLLPPWEREGEVVVKLGERAITLRPREREGEEGSLAEAMRRCSAWLLPPELVALLERQRARRLHVVPSGPLWRVPFAWLEAGGRVALDRWQIDLAPSARLAGRPDRLSSSFQAATVGHPGEPFLRSVQAEVEQVSELLGGQTLFHAKATPRRVLEEVLPRADVIHFACHGTCDPVSPLMSALLLEPDEQHPDGRLIVHRLLGVPLRAAVVSLGACHTARSEGPTSFPESLAHALVGAGVRFVIGSLWAADDAECLHFSRAFYTALKQSRDPAEAFHEAQLEQLQRLRSGASRDDGAALNDEDFARAANFVLISARNERGSTGSPVG
jgi:hypothetical protein